MTRIDIDAALGSPNPLLALREATRVEVQEHGLPPASALQQLADAMLALRAQGREDDEETVTAVMDFLVGWCSPRSAIVAPANDGVTDIHAWLEHAIATVVAGAATRSPSSP